MVAALLTLMASFTACENGDQAFDDYEGGTTAMFVYQSPVRTIVLGDDEYDTSLDKEHKCKIKATFAGSYNGRKGYVNVAVDNSLCDHLTLQMAPLSRRCCRILLSFYQQTRFQGWNDG